MMVSDKVRICCIFNFAPHYRSSIYKLMDADLKADFYFGDRTFSPLKQMDCKQLRGFQSFLSFIPLLGGFYWLRGECRLVAKDYSVYIITGDPFCLSTWCFLLLAKFRKKKTILWTHGWYGKEGLLKRSMKKIFFRMADRLLLYGNYAKNLMIENGFLPKKMYVVHNSLNYDEGLRIRDTLQVSLIYRTHFGNTHPVLIFVGRLTPVKKLNLLVDALAILLAKGEYYNIVLVGDGAIRVSLESQVKELGLCNQFWFYGESYDESVNAELIYNADLCVSPGNVGLTAIHCMTYGTPVATHSNFMNQMPEYEAIREGKTGAFFDEDSAESIASVVSAWFQKPDYSRTAIRENCYKEIDSYWTPAFQLSVFREVFSSL